MPTGTEDPTKLHRWARDDPRRRLDDLFNLVADPAFLLVAWDRVSGNKGAATAGVDGRTARSVAALQAAGLNRTARLAARATPRHYTVTDRDLEDWLQIPVPESVAVGLREMGIAVFSDGDTTSGAGGGEMRADERDGAARPWRLVPTARSVDRASSGDRSSGRRRYRAQ